MIKNMEYYKYYEITEEGFLHKKSNEEKIIKLAEKYMESKFLKDATNIKIKFLNQKIKEDDVSYSRIGMICSYTNKLGKQEIKEWTNDDFKELDLNKLKNLAKSSEIIKSYL